MLRMVLVVFEVKRYKMLKWCGGGGAGGDEDELLQEESNLWAGMPRQSTLVNCAQTTPASFEKKSFENCIQRDICNVRIKVLCKRTR